MSAPVTCDRNASAPAPVEILRQLDLIDLPTRFLFIRLLRLVTVLARLVLRLANVYHNNNGYLFTTAKKKMVSFFRTGFELWQV